MGTPSPVPGGGMKSLPLGLPPGGTLDATKLFLKPGRLTRPSKICVILRGLPGTDVYDGGWCSVSSDAQTHNESRLMM